MGFYVCCFVFVIHKIILIIHKIAGICKRQCDTCKIHYIKDFDSNSPKKVLHSVVLVILLNFIFSWKKGVFYSHSLNLYELYSMSFEKKNIFNKDGSVSMPMWECYYKNKVLSWFYQGIILAYLN